MLETIFRTTWSDLLEAIAAVEESGEPAREQLRQVAAILLRAWRRDPDLVRVLVREFARSPQMQHRVAELQHVFRALERIVARGQDSGEFRADLDPRLASFVVYGAIEEILTGWVLGLLPEGDDEVALAEQTVVDLIGDGLAAERAAAPA